MQPREFTAAQDFLVAAKRYWSTTMYRAVRDAYESRTSTPGGAPATTAREVEYLLETDTTYRYFAWLERHLQKLKYSGPYGLVPFYGERRADVRRRLDAPPVNAQLRLDPQIVLPDYYYQVDIHQHPGGLWSDDIAGFIYETGARTTTPLLGGAHATLHDRFTALVATQVPHPRRVLDLGCGFGKSTHPFARAYPEARIDAIDLSSACLRLAAAGGEPAPAAAVHYQQMDAGALDFPSSTFDLVTSTMLLHEIPPAPLRRVLEEAFRVLTPGGSMAHLDFYDLPDAFHRFLHYGHSRRNNEPYMQPLAQLDLRAVLADIGFIDCSIEPFKESDDTEDAWRFPWTLISARKPAECNLGSSC